MIFLLNYLPYFVLIVFTILAMWLITKKKYKLGWAVCIIGALLMLTLANAVSYTPKGQPERTQLEQFEAEELEMQDNLSKPDNNSAARQERIEARKEYIEKVKP
jgi:hypothetical protein